MAKLGDVCEIVSGTTPRSNVPEYWDGEINWITPAELNDETTIIYESQRKITERAVKDSSLKPFPAGTVILSSRAPIGKVAIAGVDMYCNQGFKNLICSDKIHNKYLFWFLKDRTDYLNSLGRGATFKEISKSIVEDIDLPLPSIEKQKRYAAILDKINNLISLRKQQLAKLDELVMARFVEMFGDIHKSKIYPYKTVNEITSVVSGGTPSRSIPEYWNGGNIPWVKTTELQNERITSVNEYITKAGLDNSAAKIVPAGTVLIAMYGQGKTRGMTAYLDIEASTNQACACIIPTDSVNQVYLWQYFVFSYEELRDMAKGGNQPNLNGDIIKNFPVLMPPLPLQHKFADFFEHTNSKKLTIQQGLDKMEVLKKSLMQEYFG